MMASYLHEVDPNADPDTIWGDAFFAACLRGMETGAVVAFVAVAAEDLVGFSIARLASHWYRAGVTEGLIEEFYIAPAFRGAGLGRALATETITALRARGASTLTATVVRENLAALLFWQHVGFSLEGFVLFHLTH
jgi:ribosomal protein S18 acetylase RimI-like enzyme